VTRRDRQQLADIQAALDAMTDHLACGNLSDGLVYDAVRVRLIEIGEAVKGLSADLLATEPDLPQAQIAGMRGRLAHRYFDTSHAILHGTVDHDLPVLAAEVERLKDRPRTDQPSTPMPMCG
jgi:uncharacterized protein with HEPN domain